MAKMALIERELKRDKLVAKYAKKHAELKGIASDMKRSDEERSGFAEAPAQRESDPSTQSLRDHGSSPWYVPAFRSGSRKNP